VVSAPGLRFALLAVACVSLAACGFHQPVPVVRARDARFGRLGGDGERPTKAVMCREWRSEVGGRDGWATTHVSFPETNVQSACFSPVVHEGRAVRAGSAPRGCEFPGAAARPRLLALAAELEAVAEAGGAPHRLFPCALSAAERVAASRHDARVLSALAAETSSYPYAAVVIPGHGLRENDGTALDGFLPGDACRALGEGELGRLGAMPVRSARGGDAMRGAVAPVVITSGGAVHSRLNEAFALMHLLQCRERIAPERILVEPCAEHTHTNLRNSGRWLSAMGARAAYLLTDDALQAAYFQDVTGFELLSGSIDQRSLRDWGYVLGSWRQASIGIDAGFWFTPYRFWAEPRDALGAVTCVDEP
jgi:hypothetical protein